MPTYKGLKDLTEQEEQNRKAEKGSAAVQEQVPVDTTALKPQNSAPAGGTSSGTAQGGGGQENSVPQSDLVSRAQTLLQQHLAAKPGAYQSPFQDQLQTVADQILNQGAFSYDVNADALYQQMVDQYAQQGKLAMMDTMGQAQAMTGGYGNSYAQAAGQQAYQGHMQQVTEQIPQFYQMALDQHNRERDALHDQYALLLGQDEAEYGRYKDQLSDYYAQLDRLQNQYDQERGYEYQKDRDETADKQWQAEMDETIRQFNHIHGILPETEGDGESAGDSDYARWLQWLWQQENGGEAVPLLDASVSGGLNAAGSSDLLSAAGVLGTQDGPGIDTAVQTGSMKGSAWDYVKHNLSELVDTGNLGKAKQYMGQVVGQMSDSQYEEALAILNRK